MPDKKTEAQLDALTNEQITNIVKQRNDKQIAEENKKRGSKSASIEATSTATREDIKEITGNILYWHGRKCVKSDEECAARLNEFFDRIHQTGEIPTVEKMCLALGTVRQVVWQWENGQGCSAERTDMIKKAKEILAAMDAELVSRGKIPQVTYIFRAKNFFGLRDQSELVITPNNPLGETVNADVLEEKYAELPEE